MEKYWGVYIMGNNRPTLYTGMSNNIIRRVLEHKQGQIKGFTKKYNLKKLLYYEFTNQIKNMSRKEKIKLIKTKNPYFVDISGEIFSLCDNIKNVTTYSEQILDKPE